MKPDDRRFMELAVALAARSRAAPKDPLVGAVVVKHGRILAKAYRSRTGKHAEYRALEVLRRRSVVGATVYTTLEPCTERTHPKVSCATRLVERQVGRVVIGMLDPNQNICGRGVRQLRAGGVEVALFSLDLMKEVEEQNRDFARHQDSKHARLIRCALGQTGSDYDVTRFADRKTKDLVIVAQNLQTLLARQAFLPHMRQLLSAGTRVKLVLTTFEAMSAVSPSAAVHLGDSVAQLRDFYLSVSPRVRRRLVIRFHIGAATLSLQVRDPDVPARATLVFTPKWATDAEPENRLYCVLERRTQKELFDKLYGAIPAMMMADALDLQAMCRKLRIPWDERPRSEGRRRRRVKP